MINLTETLTVSILLFLVLIIVRTGAKRGYSESKISMVLGLGIVAFALFSLNYTTLGWLTVVILVVLLIVGHIENKEKIIGISLIFMLALAMAGATISPAPIEPGSHTIMANPQNAQLLNGYITLSGDLWIMSYSTPLNSSIYPQENSQIDANTVCIDIYNPHLSGNTSLTLQIEQWSLNSQGNKTDVIMQNDTITTPYRAFSQQSFNLPNSPTTTFITIEIQGSGFTGTHKSFVQPYIPFYQAGALIFLLFLFSILAIITVISIGITKIVIARAKYFPPLTQRHWLLLLIGMGMTIYQLANVFYENLSGVSWLIYLIPYWFFIQLTILSLWKDESEKELLIHISKNTDNNDIKSKLYLIRTASSNSDQFEKQHIKDRSYIDFLKRIFGIERAIIYNGTQEDIEKMPNMSQEDIKKFVSAQGKQPKWKFKDKTKHRDHVFDAGYILDPNKPEPAIQVVKNGKFRKKEYFEMGTSGHHMKHNYHFLTEWQTTATTGEKLEQLTKSNAELIALTHIKGTQFEQNTLLELLTKIAEETINNGNKNLDFQNAVTEIVERVTKAMEGIKQGAKDGTTA